MEASGDEVGLWDEGLHLVVGWVGCRLVVADGHLVSVRLQRERQTDRERQSKRERDRQSEGERDKQRERQREKQRPRQTETGETNGERKRETDRETKDRLPAIYLCLVTSIFGMCTTRLMFQISITLFVIYTRRICSDVSANRLSPGVF